MSAFSALSRIAKSGQTVWLKIRGSTPENFTEINGIITELLTDGLVVDGNGELEYISSGDIEAWKLPKNTSAMADPQILTTILTSTPTPANTINSPQNESQKQHEPPIQYQQIQSNVTLLPKSEEIDLLFAGDPVLPYPAPSFDIPNLTAGVRKEIDRWRNRYEYAQKVREPARMAQDVAHVAELAESLSNPAIYFLAGSFALTSGLGSGRARQYFETASEHGFRPAAIALAAISIEANDWKNAAGSLLLALLIEGNYEDKTSLIRLLGQCLQLSPDKQLPRLGNLLSIGLAGTAQRLATSLIAIVVKDDAEAYSAALQNDIVKLRQCKIGNNLFPWGDESPFFKPTKKQITKAISTQSSRVSTTRKGWISAFYSDPNRNYGFIVEDATGQTWFFRKFCVEDSALFLDLEKGLVRKNVSFTGNSETLRGKYPFANDVKILSTDGSILIERKTRAPLSVRLSGIPKDGSFYARAKTAEQLDQLEEAEGLYNEEIHRNKGHAKSAIKDLAALLNRKGKPESSIELLEQYRSKYSGQELVSLDQMKVHFLVKARRYDDASKLLEKLAKQPSLASRKFDLLRQEAYCYFAASDFDRAIEKLTNLLKLSPKENATLLLLEKVKQAKESGALIDETSRMADEFAEGDESLESLASGLSALARRHLDNSELRGIDERTREKNILTERDFKEVERL